MCAALTEHGVPSGNLLVLGPGAGDPLGSDVVVATAAVRGLFGSRLAGVYAPEVLASFGTGTAQVDVRVVAAGQVDARLLITLAALAASEPASEPIRVTGFGAADPGASPGLPLRTARLAGPGGAARRMLAFLRAQRSPYQPGYAGAAGPVVTVGFAAPAPFGLLGNQ